MTVKKTDTSGEMPEQDVTTVTRKCNKRIIAKLSPNLKPSECGLRKSKQDAKVKFTELLPQMLELQAELIPFSTACDIVGVKVNDFAHWIGRYPSIEQELKRVRGLALAELQRKVARGEQGWQALCRIGELADPSNWIKGGPGRPKNDNSPYFRASKRK